MTRSGIVQAGLTDDAGRRGNNDRILAGRRRIELKHSVVKSICDIDRSTGLIDGDPHRAEHIIGWSFAVPVEAALSKHDVRAHRIDAGKGVAALSKWSGKLQRAAIALVRNVEVVAGVNRKAGGLIQAH